MILDLSFDYAQDDKDYAQDDKDYASSFDSAQDDNIIVMNGHARSLRK